MTFFGCSSGKCPGTTEQLKRQSWFSGRNIPSRNSRSIFPSHPVRPSRSFSGKWNGFAQMVNEIPGRSKFTSPEFCVPFALTVDRPVCPCKWQTTDVNAFLPRGHRYYFRKKMYFFEFFYYNILRESHRYNQNLPVNIVALDADLTPLFKKQLHYFLSLCVFQHVSSAQVVTCSRFKQFESYI